MHAVMKLVPIVFMFNLGVAVACGKIGDYTAIWEIQGDADASALVNTTVNNVRGIVTANFENGSGGPYESNGFFIQAQEPDCDTNTSDGLLVFTGTSAKNMVVGSLVEISNAKVTEYGGPDAFKWERTMTELDCVSPACTVAVLQTSSELPAAEEYLPPANAVAAQIYNEAREGMLMKVSEDMTAVTPADLHEEVALLRGAHRERLYYTKKSMQGELVFLNGNDIAAARCGAEGLPPIKTFDVVHFDADNGKQIYGPLNYSGSTYKIQQDASHFCIAVVAGNDASYSPEVNAAPASTASVMTIATYNMYNFFDNLDDPNKSDPVPSLQLYQQQSKKHAKAICAAAGLNKADIIGLEEVENDAVLTQLVSDIQNECGITYQFTTFSGPDERSIQVAALTRSDTVTVISATARQSCTASNWGIRYSSGDFPAGISCPADQPFYLFVRPPLQLDVQLAKAGKLRRVTVWVNHFKSKLAADACATYDCTDQRMEEAKQITSWVKERQQSDAETGIVVLGDLNDFDQSEPLNELNKTRGVLTDLWSLLPLGNGMQGASHRYAYIYRGAAQMLDHILVSDALLDWHPVISPRHINNDYSGKLSNGDSYYGTSDHDPLMVAVDFSPRQTNQAPLLSISQPQMHANISGSVTVQLAASDAEDAAGTLVASVAIDNGPFQNASYNINTARYEWNWNTTASATGLHTVKAKVYDSSARKVVASVVKVYVNNGACPNGFIRITGQMKGNTTTRSPPSGNTVYQSSVSGKHNGILRGPALADFDLYFWQWDGHRWNIISRSIADFSHEAITYNGTPAYYGWTVTSYRGSGDYELCFKKP